MAAPISSIQRTTPPIPEALREKTLDDEASQLAFDLGGSWIFTTSSMMKITKVVAKEIFKHAIITGVAGAVGGPAAGALAGRVTYGTSLTQLAKWVVGGAFAGGVAGAIGEYSKVDKKETVSVSTHLEVKYVIGKRAVPSQSKSELIKALFKKVQEKDRKKLQVIDPISGELLFIPVRALCDHIFEYDYLKPESAEDLSCPLCARKVSLEEISLERGTRLKVFGVVAKTLTWLSGQQSDGRVDILDENQSFLENPQPMIQKINSNQLTRAELTFLTHLVREKVQDYNQRVLDVYSSILEDISKNTRKLGRNEAARLHIQLNAWTEAFEIPLPEIQEPAPRDGPEIVEV